MRGAGRETRHDGGNVVGAERWELRMIELKREVNEMARRAEVAPPYDLTFADSGTKGRDDA